MNDSTQAEDVAKGRFLIMSLSRLMGVVMVMVGVLIVNGNIEWPAFAGYVLIATGLVEIFVIPLVLAKRWRTPQE